MVSAPSSSLFLSSTQALAQLIRCVSLAFWLAARRVWRCPNCPVPSSRLLVDTQPDWRHGVGACRHLVVILPVGAVFFLGIGTRCHPSRRGRLLPWQRAGAALDRPHHEPPHPLPATHHRVHTHARTHTRAHTHTHTRAHAHTRAHTHAHTRTHQHTRTHTHQPTHAHTWRCVNPAGADGTWAARTGSCANPLRRTGLRWNRRPRSSCAPAEARGASVELPGSWWCLFFPTRTFNPSATNTRARCNT